MFAVYAAMVPVPEQHRPHIIGLEFATQAEALERASHLRRQGWHVYRVTGPDGFEMVEKAIDQHCQMPYRGD